MGGNFSTTKTNPSESQEPDSRPNSSIRCDPNSTPNSTVSNTMPSPDPKRAKSDTETLMNDNQSTQWADSQDRQGSETLENVPDQSRKKEEGGEGEEGEEEEEGECPFCLFMKGGGCKDSFIAWENCVEEAEKNNEDIVTKCMDVTANLKKCMDAHSDYYEPILKAEKAAEEAAKKELEREAAAEESKGNAGSEESEKKAES